MPSGNSDRTISFWLYLPSNANILPEYAVIYIGGTTCSIGQEFMIQITTNDVVTLGSCNLGTWYFSSLKLIRNNWNFVAITFGQTNQATAYVNGANNYQTLTINGINTVASKVRFGSRLLTNTVAGAGYLTDIRIWNRVLTTSEINNVIQFQPVTSGLVSAWDGSLYANTYLRDIVCFNNGYFSHDNMITNGCPGNSIEKINFKLISCV